MCNVPECAIFKVFVVLTGKCGKINDRVCVIELICSWVCVIDCYQHRIAGKVSQ